MDITTLQKTAQAMIAHGKGILAIDESDKTCKKRFDALGIPCTEENRRAYRDLLITAPGIEQYLSGMILYDETFRQKKLDGTPFPKALKDRGILPGIKVDAGLVNMALHPGEKVAEGLDQLAQRLAEYKSMGAEFAKWRIVINIGENIPTQACIKANTHTLARYAAICQEAGIVPMVEPEILIDGNHSIKQCYQVTSDVLKNLFAQLKEQDVNLSGVILKVSMVLPGKESPKASVKEVAQQTIKCLKKNVPKELAGVVFLSGGQTDEESAAHLSVMHQLGKLPWPLTFSYGRAIQAPALNTWSTNLNEVKSAQAALLFRAKMCSLASMGQYTDDMEKQRLY